MKRRLNYYRFYVRIAAFLLPLAAFAGTSYIESFLPVGNSRAGLSTYGFFSLLVQTSVIWAIAVEYYGVSSVQELFLERTGIRNAVSACTATYTGTLGV